MDDAGASLPAQMGAMGREARKAAVVLRLSDAATRTKALQAMAAALRVEADAILAANARDVADAQAAGLAPAMVDRLLLDPARVEAMAKGVETVAAIRDPLGAEIDRWDRPNGLDIARVRTPIGVIAIIYESRPNVTADAAALCLRAGNAVILRGGSECLASNLAIHAAVAKGLAQAGLPEACVQMVRTADRAAVGLILGGLEGAVDLIIPRGGKSLVARVQAEARAPVLGHLEGINHVFLHASADLEKAIAITVNAKLRRVSVCGAAETLLVDSADAQRLLPPVARALADAGCELRGDARARSLVPGMAEATEADWSTEYLAPIISVAVVDGVDGAAAHIAAHGSAHTDAIVAEDGAAAERFAALVDSAIVLINASTQFADGGEFGFGAEIGIATDRLHARGPVGAEQLTTYKYVVRGTGQTRP
ncbi:MAG TPA: glutamate-5-semialdehyde dehydrogenase [Phenylobacterium sp.]|jgi:glutamate-5-semialdehyde dehydrogenase|uniref:glutamate-5-semialdehyde dehydrogenase n=1 Tax=Phenylobacterium sp. TaxID=1871053 RepID=UPI002D66810D|nr:glutamate-5-semialdehyde dehydrogenase [Phenylobacterium sp.]HZZ67991.1 glutamate-5-semialdehyde dehydrogenase [Phenylobacterium sp.]